MIKVGVNLKNIHWQKISFLTGRGGDHRSCHRGNYGGVTIEGEVSEETLVHLILLSKTELSIHKLGHAQIDQIVFI